MANNHNAGEHIPPRLFYYNAGFLRQKRLRRILELAGHRLCLGLPKAGDGVVVWGRSPYAKRGEAVAARFNAPLIRLEDAFLRSILPGRAGDPPIGLIIDPVGVHFDCSAPSLLEHILNTHPLDDPALLSRAHAGMMRLQSLHLSKYNAHDPNLPAPMAGYVLVVDQTKGDASIHHAGANEASFHHMLDAAKQAFPDRRILIKTHPETQMGHRSGHFGADDCTGRIQLYHEPISPYRLLKNAHAVYCVSSQFGMEAIFAGHRPYLFGHPFYAGWGLSHDPAPNPRRRRTVTAQQLFAAAMILAPVWYDPCRDQLCSFEVMLDQFEAELRCYREDKNGYVATGMRLWKRRPLQAFFGRHKPLVFCDPVPKALKIAAQKQRPLLVWANKRPALHDDAPVTCHIEDGFLRSRGLGAALVPPLSLVSDPIGIYYDPRTPSRLEQLIPMPLSDDDATRARALQQHLIKAKINKYNLGGYIPNLPKGHLILVPGQVEDDASILFGGGNVRTNRDLIAAVRKAKPDAVIIYKPHPDVEAGLRIGNIGDDHEADLIARHADPLALIAACDEIWTMTSLLGFEALVRGKPVTCLGAPFYAGWGLTTDLGPVPERRFLPKNRQPNIAQLIYATLIAYPRYYDPISKRPCPAEIVLERLADGHIPRPSLGTRALAKLQGAFSSYSHWWR